MNYPFQEQSLNNKISDSGYVITPFFSPDEVQSLLNIFLTNHNSSIPGFYASSHSSDKGFRKSMSDKIRKAIISSTKIGFENVEFLGGSFIVKTKDEKNRLNPHQDWSIVDERHSDSFNIWIPLVDVNNDNGAIRVVPKSHLWFSNQRGPNIPDPLDKYQERVWDKMIDLPMKAGEALIYNHKLYHASTPNITDELRVAAVFGLKQKDKPMFYYFGNDSDVEVYKSNVDFFLSGNIQEGNKELELITKSSLEVGINNNQLPSEFNDSNIKVKSGVNLFLSLLKKLRTK